MKKSLLAVLLAVALVVPVFAADKGDMEADVKVGVVVTETIDVDGYSEYDDVDTAFSLGADFFYYVDPSVAIGFGIDNIFNSEIKNSDGSKLGFTNIYAQVKPVIDLENDIFSNIYFLGQIGYGITNVDSDWVEVSSNGLYWGIGVGTTIKENFIAELVYSTDYATMEVKGYGVEVDCTYSALKLNFGYKFSL